MTHYPTFRGRRLRGGEPIRSLVRETRLSPSQLILPLFAVPGSGVRTPVVSMPGVFRTSVDELVKDAREARDLGLGGVLLFGIPKGKDAVGTEAWADDGVVQTAVRRVKAEVPGLLVITDVCLCAYTDHGHCGVLDGDHVLNDPTLEGLARVAVSHARAGADAVAPSDMMDGRVTVMREALTAAGFEELPIFSYAVKYASAFYGPFREAADSAPQFGDRRSYQMDPPNAREALKEIATDIQEGADIVMVKPALAYLDVIARARRLFNVPLAAYQVSGEYSMIEAAARNGWIDRERTILESTTAIKRAGADILITYYALELARSL